MNPKRQYRRYHADVAVIAATSKGTYVLSPQDISPGGCFCPSSPPWPGETPVTGAEILVDGSSSIKCDNVVAFERGVRRNRSAYRQPRRGYGLMWTIPPVVARSLEEQLKAKLRTPSADEKISYIIADQQAILEEINSLERGKTSRFRFLFTAIVAFMAYLVAPYKVFTQITTEAVVFYALTGLWGATTLLIYSTRYLRYLKTSFRRKAFLYKAYNVNRAYVFAGDDTYYEHTLFPLGTEYDDARVWSYSSDEKKQRLEAHPGRMEYSSLYPTWYIIVVQALFLGGLIHFAGMILHAWVGSTEGFVRHDNGPPTLNLFSIEYFISAFAMVVGVVLLWIQLVGNTCLAYQRAVFEARRITIARPNPRCAGEAIHEITRDGKITGIVVGIFMTFSLVSLWRVWDESRAAKGAFAEAVSKMGVLDPYFDSTQEWALAGLLVCLGFLAGKIGYVWIAQWLERRKDKTATTLISRAGVSH